MTLPCLKCHSKFQIVTTQAATRNPNLVMYLVCIQCGREGPEATQVILPDGTPETRSSLETRARRLWNRINMPRTPAPKPTK